MSFRNSPFFLFIALFLSACWLTDKQEKKEISSDMINDPGSASGQVEGPKPELSFEDTIHGFGTISQGEQVRSEFVFHNSGDAPLVIVSIEPSCGCTVSEEAPEEPIMPGEGDTLHVTYDSKGHSGYQDRIVSVVANTDPQTTVLRMQGTVRGPK